MRDSTGKYEEGRSDGRTISWFDDAWRDTVVGARMLRKSPAFTIVAIVTLALGIGANTAIFSVVNAVLLRPLPYREPGRLVMLCESKPAAGTAQSVVSTTAFAEWRKRCRSVEQSAAVRFDNFVLGGDGGPERLLLCQASADYFPLLGLKPVL